MKRLTEYTIPETGFSVVSEEKYKRIMMEEKPSLEKVYNRLKKIEDILGDEYDLDELKEVVQAKREGRCVVLPAKTVFELTWDAGPECDMACPVYIDGAEECSFCDKGKLFVYERPCKQEHIERIGEDVFLIRSEAEAALSERG